MRKYEWIGTLGRRMRRGRVGVMALTLMVSGMLAGCGGSTQQSCIKTGRIDPLTGQPYVYCPPSGGGGGGGGGYDGSTDYHPDDELPR